MAGSSRPELIRINGAGSPACFHYEGFKKKGFTMKSIFAFTAVSASLFLATVANPSAALAGGFIKTTRYDVTIRSAELNGAPVGNFSMNLSFVYGGCCMMSISPKQIPHMYADVASPFVAGRYQPISEPPFDTPLPCEGGIGHCSAQMQMWDEMEMVNGQFLQVHLAALPANLGNWNFSRFGRYTLKAGDMSELRFQLDTDRGTFAGLGDIMSVTSWVPEPATWGLMLGGFGLVGAVSRRRRARAA
jgi:hypothetical protein